MDDRPPRLPLSRGERQARVVLLVCLVVAALAVFLIFPRGAKLCVWHGVTGLPCLFCGMTRASHCLMHGDWAGALYYNWLILPVAAGVFLFYGILGAELLAGRSLAPWRSWLGWVRRGWVLPVVLVAALWALHIRDAVKTPKPELLDASAPAYLWLIPWMEHSWTQPETKHE